MWWFRRGQYQIIALKQTSDFSDMAIFVISHGKRDELILQHYLFMDLLAFQIGIFKIKEKATQPPAGIALMGKVKSKY